MYLQTLSRGVDKLEMRHGFAAGDQNLDFNSYISTKISTLIVLGFQGGTNSPPIWLINKFFFLKDYTCEDDLVCRNTNEKIPYFNAPVYLENKQQIGKVDEIFGSITESVSFNVHIIHNSKDNKHRFYKVMYLQTLSRGVDKLEMRHGFAAGDQNLDFNSYISTKIST
jgi:rRNA processing protein Gar1